MLDFFYVINKVCTKEKDTKSAIVTKTRR